MLAANSNEMLFRNDQVAMKLPPSQPLRTYPYWDLPLPRWRCECVGAHEARLYIKKLFAAAVLERGLMHITARGT